MSGTRRSICIAEIHPRSNSDPHRVSYIRTHSKTRIKADGCAAEVSMGHMSWTRKSPLHSAWTSAEVMAALSGKSSHLAHQLHLHHYCLHKSGACARGCMLAPNNQEKDCFFRLHQSNCLAILAFCDWRQAHSGVLHPIVGQSILSFLGGRRSHLHNVDASSGR